MFSELLPFFVLGLAGLLIVPMGIFISQMEKRAARKRGQAWPAE